jgi:hypothetical protein
VTEVSRVGWWGSQQIAEGEQPPAWAVCPPWCTTEPQDHSWTIDLDHGPVVDHSGPRFGEHISTGASVNIEGRIVDAAVEIVDLDLVALRAADDVQGLASALSGAASWLAGVQESQQ